MTQATEAEVKALIAPRFASDLPATEWYDMQPISGFGGLTARQLVEQRRGNEVAQFLSAVDSGVHA
ncbi:hypothetical protein KUV75_01545 [Qipengyuania gaetbuli]|uniref:hypothetical protein n=1 Tax=Qipengyuania gaetbuli TaxID=266952 RepID=UPI001C995B9C|nr:hypothetical protein [Qipengyuania gaetbuli]MBY6013587.1 hypothetical protein [Qipengyuania gaetbuli]